MNLTELDMLGVEPQELEKGAYRIRLTSNSQSLEILSQLAREYAIHPRIRALVAELLRNCKEKDYDCYIDRITSFVKENIKYVNDPPRAEVFQSPLRTLEWGLGDCDDFAVLTASLLLSAGLNARPVIRRVNDRWGHVVVEVFHPEKRKWLEIDTTNKEDDMESVETPLYELGLEEQELPEIDELELMELGKPFTGKKWILAWRRTKHGNRLFKELWYYVNGRRHKLLKRVYFTGNRWIVRKVPLYRSPNSPIAYYKELWQYKNGVAVKRLKRIRWKVVRPHHHSAPHVVHHHPNQSHAEAGFLNEKTIPLLFGAGVLLYLLKK